MVSYPWTFDKSHAVQIDISDDAKIKKIQRDKVQIQSKLQNNHDIQVGEYGVWPYMMMIGCLYSTYMTLNFLLYYMRHVPLGGSTVDILAHSTRRTCTK